MRSIWVALVLGMGSMYALPSFALAQHVDATATIEMAQVLRELDTMRARQDALEAENERLRTMLEEEPGGTQLAPVAAAGPSDETSVGLYTGGGGFFVKGEDYQLRLLGYAQAVGSVFDSRLDRADGNGDFSIRRARIDFLADFFEDYQLFVELDGGPGSTPGTSDFALVEARLNWRIMEDAVQLRVGKFTTPFSTENFRSSRDIDTVERFIALNSLFALPALDVQFGGMVHGKIGGDRSLGYFLGAFNGSGRANDNLSDDNDNKELMAKLTYSEPGWSAGLAFDYAQEESQTLTLSDLSFSPFVSIPVEERRVGVGADVFWENGPWSVRAEGLMFRFDSPEQSEVWLSGGFIQPARYLWGDRQEGLQLLLRTQLAQLDAETGDNGDTLYAATLGANWFVNPNVRVQFNAVLQYFNGSSTLRGFDDEELIPLLLTEVQFKF